MKLIKDFRAPTFTRVTYHSKEAQEYWSRLMTLASQYAQTAELVTVAEEIRDCGTTHIPNINGDRVYRKLADLGLKWRRLRKVGSSTGFSHRAHPPVKEGDSNFSWFSVVSKKEECLDEFADAIEKGNHIMIGDFLGYPSCCTSWFSRVWPKFCDPIWQIAENTPGAKKAEWPFEHKYPIKVLKVKGHPYTNPMMRYSNVRMMFHLPCSFQCEETIKRAEKWFEVLKELDENAARATGYLLSLPLAWDCCHGYLKVVNPPFSVHAGSVECAYRHVIWWEPSPCFLPDEDIPGAVSGTVYPFMRPVRKS